MACRGVLFAITEEQAHRLRAARGDDAAVLHIVQDEIEQAWDEAHLCQTDKAWDAIHRCLGDGTLNKAEAGGGWFRFFGSRTATTPAPLKLCILGGEQLHQGGGYIVSLLTPEQVKQVAEALRPIDKEWMRTRYFKIDPEGYWLPDGLSEQDFEYTWDWFEGVNDFYRKAVEEGRWTIFTVDQ